MSVGVIEPVTDERTQPVKPSAAKSWLKAIELTSRIEAEPNKLFADIIEDHAARRPHGPSLLSEIETLSYAELAQRINRYARWALSSGIKPGDTVCLFMQSRPDYVAAWLGISKVGGVAALINPKLVGTSLSHCINVAAADHVVLSADLADVFETAMPYLCRVPKIWLPGGRAEFELDDHAAVLDDILDRMGGGPLEPAERGTV